MRFCYLKGQFSRIVCTWYDQQRVLTLRTDAQGKLPSQEAMVVEIAGVAGSKPVTTRNGSIQL